MGTIHSKDTRRISFDNNFAVAPVITVTQNSIEDESIVLESLSEVSKDWAM